MAQKDKDLKIGTFFKVNIDNVIVIELAQIINIKMEGVGYYNYYYKVLKSTSSINKLLVFRNPSLFYDKLKIVPNTKALQALYSQIETG